jgi:hypothetical protein
METQLQHHFQKLGKKFDGQKKYLIKEAFAKRLKWSRIEKLVGNPRCSLDFSILDHFNPIAK